jgi:hypothetical protein
MIGPSGNDELGEATFLWHEVGYPPRVFSECYSTASSPTPPHLPPVPLAHRPCVTVHAQGLAGFLLSPLTALLPLLPRFHRLPASMASVTLPRPSLSCLPSACHPLAIRLPRFPASGWQAGSRRLASGGIGARGQASGKRGKRQTSWPMGGRCGEGHMTAGFGGWWVKEPVGAGWGSRKSQAPAAAPIVEMAKSL